MINSQQQESVDIYDAAKQRAFNKPKWFFKRVLKYPIKPWQLKAVEVVLDVERKHLGIKTKYNHKGKPRLSIRSCHGTGKTQFLALLMHLWNFIHYGKIACTAPKEAQLLRRLMPRYRDSMRKADVSYQNNIDVQGREIILFKDKDWGANMETASDPDNLAGYHDKPQLFLVDEAAAKRLDLMYPVIEGALTTPGSVVVEIGNPTRVEGEFYSHHNVPKIKELYYLMHIKYSDAEDLISKQWVESMATKYGKESPIYKIRVAGEFAAFDEYILIPPEFIEEAFDYEEVIDGSIPVLKISIDVADGGADSTVISAANHYKSYVQILKQKAFYFKPSVAIPEAADAAVAMMEGFGGTKQKTIFIIDAVGVGAGVAGNLIKAGYNVVRNVGGENADDPLLYRNRRVQNYIKLWEAYTSGTIRFSPDAVDDEEELRAHLLSIKRNKDNEKVDDIEPKKNIKRDGLPSPDRADNLSMQYNGELPTMGVVGIMPQVIGKSVNAGYDGSIA